MRVSLITPTYRRAKYLVKNYNHLRLLRNKNYLEWIIISENNDHLTRSLVKTFDKKFVKHFSGNFKSNDKAFNYGLKVAKGDLICIYGDDDFLENNTIQILKNVYKKKSIWYVGKGAYIDQNFLEIKKIITILKNYLHSKYNSSTLYLINYFMASSVFFSREFVLKKFKNISEEKYSSDYDLWCKLQNFQSPVIIDKILSKSMYSPVTKTGNFSIKKFWQTYMMIFKYKKSRILKSLKFFSFLITVIYNFIIKKINFKFV
jgi:hypothetical protein